MTQYESKMEEFRKAKEGAKNLVLIDGERRGRKYYLRIIGGIVDGVQVIDFANREEAEEYALDELRPFYKRMGKRIRVNLANDKEVA